ncbi:hypothetical protein BV898_18813 [Hypsibius exemplaris]|uniref:Uncharacterized protein n=1 Tax=Hypsibius exemplaris TaxID=2072580 RepID=A0A9X6RNC7_HYPEX|nr:hypothetical protein BV898_18813 [Hypsibius exemplaris]
MALHDDGERPCGEDTRPLNRRLLSCLLAFLLLLLPLLLLLAGSSRDQLTENRCRRQLSDDCDAHHYSAFPTQSDDAKNPKGGCGQPFHKQKQRAGG